MNQACEKDGRQPVVVVLACFAVLFWSLSVSRLRAAPPDRAETSPMETSPAVPATPVDRIDLSMAFGLAGLENPTIAIAVEDVVAAQSRLLGAQAALLPTLNAGASFDLHRGPLLGSGGVIQKPHRESAYIGAGARAIGAGTVTVPGVHLVAHVADAIFEPRAARQDVEGRNFDAQAARNAVLLQVADAYLSLAGAEADFAAIQQSEKDLAELVRLTANFARTGQGRPGDAERAQAEALLLHTEEQRAEGAVMAASAALAQLLNLDPSTRLRVAEIAIPLLQLVDPATSLEQLLEVAQTNRPEIWARSADVALAETRWHQERVRPFLPVISLGFSAGDFGGGSNLVVPRFGRSDARTDFDVVAFWSLQNLGLGNRAIQRERRAEVGQAEAERARVLDMINREVVDAYNLSAARRRQVDLALRRIKTSQDGFHLDLTRAKNLQGRLIETLSSLNQLTAARRELVRLLVAYNQAQFQLFVSLGEAPDLASPLSGTKE